MIKRPVVWMTAAFVLGEVIACLIDRTAVLSKLSVAVILTVLLCAGFLAAASACLYEAESLRQRKKNNGRAAHYCGQVSFAAILLFLFMAGAIRMAQEQKKDPLEAYLEENDVAEEAVISGTVWDISAKNGWYTLILSDVSVRLSGKEYRQKRLAVSGKETEIPVLSSLSCGTEVLAGGKAELPDEARNPGEFSYRLYYRGLKVRCQIKADWLTAGKNTGAPLERHADKFRKFAKKALGDICSERDAGIFCAVLLGDKSELDEGLKDLFEDSGIAHILAVSGLHVSLIGLSIYAVLRKLGFSYGLSGGISSFILLFYGTVTGFGASVFRAVFMVLCSMAAACMGRSYDLLSAMSLSLFLLAADSPFLLFSGGLQLSYGAAAAIGLEQNLQRQREKERILSGKSNKERIFGKTEKNSRFSGVVFLFFSGPVSCLLGALRMSAAIQLYTLPIILYHFFSFPPWGIFLNLLVIPLMSYAAGSGIIALIFCGICQFVLWVSEGIGASAPGSFFVSLLSALAGGLRAAAFASVGPGHYIFSLYDIVCRWSQKLPFSSLSAGRPDWVQIALFYLFVVYRYLRKSGFGKNSGMGGRECRRECFYCAIAGTAASVFLFLRPVHGLNMWFLDVGQGDCVFIQTKNISILSDCGSSQDSRAGEKRLLPFLQSRGITKLDYVFVSHADQDHINGIRWLLNSSCDIEVGCLVMPEAGKGRTEYEELELAASEQGAEVRYWKRGDRLVTGNFSVTCLYPEPGTDEAEKNAHSLVLSVRWKEFGALLTGDIGFREETLLTSYRKAESQLSSSVLKAAHHGSGESSSQSFLDAVSPSVYIISYGKGNPYGHPSPETVKRMEEAGGMIWSTADSGAVRIYTDGEMMEVSPFLEKPGGQEPENGA